MKRGGWWWALLLVFGSLGVAQDAQEQRQQQQQQEQPQQKQQPQQRPTLGPAPAPTLRGPRTSTTNDARRLARVRTLYVERIDNFLSEKLIEALAKMGRFRMASQAKEADATLRGSCVESRRLKRVHSEVYINDRYGVSIWQDSIYRPYNPPSLEQAVNETALLAIDDLGESIRAADRK